MTFSVYMYMVYDIHIFKYFKCTISIFYIANNTLQILEYR